VYSFTSLRLDSFTLFAIEGMLTHDLDDIQQQAICHASQCDAEQLHLARGSERTPAGVAA
jgi:hypothetical protein